LFDAGFIALVERPLFDFLGVDQPRLRQYPQVFTRRRLRDPEFLRDIAAAYSVFDPVTIHLRRESPGRIFEPFQDLEAAIIGDGPQGQFKIHIDN
jgi:hypothetical protein